MLTENGLSPFWGEGAKECPSATDSPPPRPLVQSTSSLERELDHVAR